MLLHNFPRLSRFRLFLLQVILKNSVRSHCRSFFRLFGWLYFPGHSPGRSACLENETFRFPMQIENRKGVRWKCSGTPISTKGLWSGFPQFGAPAKHGSSNRVHQSSTGRRADQRSPRAFIRFFTLRGRVKAAYFHHSQLVVGREVYRGCFLPVAVVIFTFRSFLIWALSIPQPCFLLRTTTIGLTTGPIIYEGSVLPAKSNHEGKRKSVTETTIEVRLSG